ncbi:MAG: ATP-grasp domain-containing protein [Ruminococcaceae bacterium]|nr:ATP-grasp domain-containing protein [Oscillospiraceae bacterium]
MIIVTDCMYRSSIAVIHTLKELKLDFTLVTVDTHPKPASFYSRFKKGCRVLPHKEEEYSEALLNLCREFDRPVILPMGVFTLNILAKNRTEFEKISDFLVSSPEILDRLNDKKFSKALAEDCAIRVPKRFANKEDVSFPLVVKPFCGEMFGLSARNRYKIVKTEKELEEALELFSPYDSSPLIEEYVEGVGVGVSLVIGKDKKVCSAFCHKRLSEYPADGGPSTSLITFRDDSLIKSSADMLIRAGFVGIAMIEYKEKDGKYYFLEINPRIWGSFGATFKAKSNFLQGYVNGAKNSKDEFSYEYVTEKKIKFMPNIAASVFSYFKKGMFKKGISVLGDLLNPFVPDAFFTFSDPFPAILDIFRKRR